MEMISTLHTYWYCENQNYVVTIEDINDFLNKNRVKIRNVKLFELKKFINTNLDPKLIKE